MSFGTRNQLFTIVFSTSHQPRLRNTKIQQHLFGHQPVSSTIELSNTKQFIPYSLSLLPFISTKVITFNVVEGYPWMTPLISPNLLIFLQTIQKKPGQKFLAVSISVISIYWRWPTQHPSYWIRWVLVIKPLYWARPRTNFHYLVLAGKSKGNLVSRDQRNRTHSNSK